METILLCCVKLLKLPVMLLTANATDIVDGLRQCTDDYSDFGIKYSIIEVVLYKLRPLLERI